MNKTTRREFIKKSGFTMLTVGLSQNAFLRHVDVAAQSALTQAAALSANDNMLVVIQLSGGNDGINTVMPRGGSLRSLYEQFRPSLQIPVADILPIADDAAGNQLGLHPSFQPLNYLQEQNHLGIIQAVGYPRPDYSHFRSMEIWHTGKPDGLKSTGWLGDYLDIYPSTDKLLLALAIGGGRSPLSLRARQVVSPSVYDVNTYEFPVDASQGEGESLNRIETFLALNQETASERVLYEQIRLSGLDTYNSTQRVQKGIRNYIPDPAIDYARDPNNFLAQALGQVAQLMAGNNGTKIFYVVLSSFDTHLDQAETQAGLFRHLSEAVSTFHQDLIRLGKDEKVMMMTWSEFGRKVRENGSRGTDHGAAGPQLVMGTPVKGGVFGEHPSLTDLYAGQDAVKHSIDFRSIYATILERWLEVDSREILDGSFELLDFV